MSKVIKIPRKAKRKYNKKTRTVAYCRVSGKDDVQLGSINNQKEHYQRMISDNPRLKLINIYFDYGKSGLRIQGRDAFQQMIKDAKQRKFNLIITKSISRFSRNTVDLVGTVRMLKKYNVNVYFEEENMNTKNLDSELYLSVFSALAQEQSRSLSENTKWGIKRKMEIGGYSVKTVYGYKKSEGRLVIDTEQAETVKLIYEMYLSGKTCKQISDYLSDENIQSPTNGCNWNARFIERVLCNEKYVGDVIFQKSFTENYVESKRVANRGEQNKYHIDNNHEAIIDESVYNKVQEEKQKRSRFEIDDNGNKVFRKHQYSKYELTNVLSCEYCGASYRRRTERGKVVYRCATRMEKGRSSCPKSITIIEN